MRVRAGDCDNAGISTYVYGIMLLATPSRLPSQRQTEAVEVRLDANATPDRDDSTPFRNWSMSDRNDSTPLRNDPTPDRNHSTPDRNDSMSLRNRSMPNRSHSTPIRNDLPQSRFANRFLSGIAEGTEL